jgi:hypothetical protein
MGFWEAATDQAGREFGARHWRWFAGARVVRKLAPAISVIVILGALVLAYRLVSPDWEAIGTAASGRAPSLGGALLWAAAVAVGALVVGAGLVWLVRRNWWRWWNLNRPMWMRRY